MFLSNFTIQLSDVELFPLMGVDFLVSEEGELYFLEVNSIPAGTGIAGLVSDLISMENNSKKEWMDLGRVILESLEKFLKYYLDLKGIYHKEKSTVVMIEPKYDVLPVLKLDRLKILNYLSRNGFKTISKGKRGIMFGPNGLEVKYNNGVITPEIVIRRVTGIKVWPNSRQLVLNPSVAGGLSSNKFTVYEILKNVLKKTRLAVKIPRYYLARSKEELLWAIEEIKEFTKTIVLKPVNGHGGKGIKFIEAHAAAKFKDRVNYPVIVQEMIKSHLFKGSNGGKYVFDIRGFIIGGLFSGLHLRRSSCPAKDYSNGKCLISNISSGGVYVHSFYDDTLAGISQVKLLRDYSKVVPGLPKIEKNVVILGKDIIEAISEASRHISTALIRELTVRMNYRYKDKVGGVAL